MPSPIQDSIHPKSLWIWADGGFFKVYAEQASDCDDTDQFFTRDLAAFQETTLVGGKIRAGMGRIAVVP